MTSPLRSALASLVVLALGAVVLFSAGVSADLLRFQDPGAALAALTAPEVVAALLDGAGEVAAAVLAIAITVVAIVVELASNRYTHRTSELFLGERVNLGVMAFLVLTVLQCLWTGAAPLGPVSAALSLGMLSVSLLLLLPYFAYVFAFLDPLHIVQRIRQNTLEGIRRAPRDLDGARRSALRGAEQIASVALAALERSDQEVGVSCVDALGALLRDYRADSAGRPDAWYRADDLAQDPDFCSMTPEVLALVGARRTWLELKVLRQHQTIFTRSLGSMRDIAYRVSIDTRLLAESALTQRDEPTVELCLQFFNTYLREALERQDARTAENLLYQYRLLALAVLERGSAPRALEIARYFKYYGLTAQGRGVSGVLETAAHDLSTLTEAAWASAHPTRHELLEVLLRVDREGPGAGEPGLRGVRKAQVRLATWFLHTDDQRHALTIFRDMQDEAPELLALVRDELLAVTRREHWEVSDRGVRMDWLPPERRACLDTFFSWFGDRLPVHRAGRGPLWLDTLAETTARVAE